MATFTFAEVEAMAEDIPEVFKESDAYHDMCNLYGSQYIDFHLRKWLMKHWNAKGDPNALCTVRVDFDAEDVDELGGWATSPQGSSFWGDMHDNVCEERPASECSPKFLEKLYDMR